MVSWVYFLIVEEIRVSFGRTIILTSSFFRLAVLHGLSLYRPNALVLFCFSQLCLTIHNDATYLSLDRIVLRSLNIRSTEISDF